MEVISVWGILDGFLLRPRRKIIVDGIVVDEDEYRSLQRFWGD